MASHSLTFPCGHDPHTIYEPTTEEIEKALRSFSEIGGGLLGDLWLKARYPESKYYGMLFWVSEDSSKAIIQHEAESQPYSQFMIRKDDDFEDEPFVIMDPGCCDIPLSTRNLIPIDTAIEVASRFARSGTIDDGYDWEDYPID